MLEYKVDGPALKDGIPLHIAVASLDSFQAVLDKTYLVAVGSKKMSSRDRNVFQLKASSFSRGSLVATFEIILTGVQLALPFVGTLGPQNIWEYTKDTFNFLKVVCGSVQNGEKPQYVFKNNGAVTVKTGNTVNNYYAPVIQIGESALPNYQHLAHLIDPKKLDEISAGQSGQEKPDIFIGKNDRNIFDIPTRIEKETIRLLCEIYDFNKYKNVGRLSVKDQNQPVPPGEYSFTIDGSQNYVDYIYSMLKPEVELACLVELESNPFGDDKVHQLHITGVKSKQITDSNAKSRVAQPNIEGRKGEDQA